MRDRSLVEAIDQRQDGRRFGLKDLPRERAIGWRCAVIRGLTPVTSRRSDPRHSFRHQSRIRCRSSGRGVTGAHSALRFSPPADSRGPRRTAHQRLLRRQPTRAARYIRPAGRHAVAAARQLQTLRHIKNHGIAKLSQHRKRAHVHDEVVLAEAEPRSVTKTRVSRFGDLGHACSMSAGARNCPFLILTTRPSCGGDDQVGLAIGSGISSTSATRRPARWSPSWTSVRIGTSSRFLIAAST